MKSIDHHRPRIFRNVWGCVKANTNVHSFINETHESPKLLLIPDKDFNVTPRGHDRNFVNRHLT